MKPETFQNHIANFGLQTSFLCFPICPILTPSKYSRHWDIMDFSRMVDFWFRRLGFLVQHYSKFEWFLLWSGDFYNPMSCGLANSENLTLHVLCLNHYSLLRGELSLCFGPKSRIIDSAPAASAPSAPAITETSRRCSCRRWKFWNPFLLPGHSCLFIFY